MTRVTAVMVNWNQAELTERAADAIAQQVDTVVIVDNASVEPQRQRLHRFSKEKEYEFIETAANLGYAGGCNAGIRHAIDLGADQILVMNNDVFLDSGSLLALQRALGAGVGAVGPAVYEHERPDVALHVACSFNRRTGATCWLRRGESRSRIDHQPCETCYVSGELILTRSSVFDKCGLFDERLVSYYEDVEWSWRVREHGMALVVVPEAIATHMVGASGETVRGSYLRARNRVLVLRQISPFGPFGAALGAMAPTFIAVASMVRRGMWRGALDGPLRGWATGIRESLGYARSID